MNAAEHYAEAERLLARANEDVSENFWRMTGERKSDILAAAQVHATLALAFTTAAYIERLEAPVFITNVSDGAR